MLISKHRQRVLDLTMPLIRDQLLKPRGLEFPDIPVKSVSKVGDFVRGRTLMDQSKFEFRPTGILIGNPADISPDAAANSRSETTVMSMVGTLAHEMVHAALAVRKNLYFEFLFEGPHSHSFAKEARAIGLVGPAPATVVGRQFRDWYLKSVVPVLQAEGLDDGDYVLYSGRGHDNPEWFKPGDLT